MINIQKTRSLPIWQSSSLPQVLIIIFIHLMPLNSRPWFILWQNLRIFRQQSTRCRMNLSSGEVVLLDAIWWAGFRLGYARINFLRSVNGNNRNVSNRVCNCNKMSGKPPECFVKIKQLTTFRNIAVFWSRCGHNWWWLVKNT